MEKKFVEGQKGDDITPFDGTEEKVPVLFDVETRQFPLDEEKNWNIFILIPIGIRIDVKIESRIRISKIQDWHSKTLPIRNTVFTKFLYYPVLCLV